MKHIYMAIVLWAMASLPVTAGGYVAPTPDVIPVTPVLAQPAFNWEGPYAGITAGRTKQTKELTYSKEYIEKKVWVKTDPEDMFPGCHYGNNTCPVQDGVDEWGSPIWKYEPVETDTLTDEDMQWVRGEPWTESFVESISSKANTYGAFVGYRYQYTSKIVSGIELNYSKTNDLDTNMLSLEAQVGYAIGKFLPYAAIGYASSNDEQGWLAAVGTDFAITNNTFVGIKYTKYDFDTMDVDNLSVRFGIKF